MILGSIEPYYKLGFTMPLMQDCTLVPAATWLILYELAPIPFILLE